jgi:hypothetical protein
MGSNPITSATLGGIMKRPLRERIWFYKPEWPKGDEGFVFKHDFVPFHLGDDEYHWRTWVFGTNLTGQIVFAAYEFECDDEWCRPSDYPGWPVTMYEWEDTFGEADCN